MVSDLAVCRLCGSEPTTKWMDDLKMARCESGNCPLGSLSMPWLSHECWQTLHDESVTESEWLPIETAPKDGSEILLCSLGDIGVCYWRDDEQMTGWTWGLGKAFLLPTGWMPLPETKRISGEGV